MKNASTKTAVFVFGLHARRIGGIEHHTREISGLLGALGWQVVLCFRQEPSGDVREFLSLANVRFEVLPEAAVNSRRSALDLRRILRRYRPLLVHFQFTPLLGFNAWIARLCGARAIVFTDHGSHPENFRPQPASGVKKLAARLLTLPVSRVICVSDYNRGVLATLGTIGSVRLQRIYNGIDLSRAENPQPSVAAAFRKRFLIAEDRIVVTQISAMSPEKGVGDLLAAARAAIHDEPALHFVIAGDGSHRDEYIRRAGEIGISSHVTFTGLLSDPMGDGVFAASQICCQASRWEEAFGLVIAEAMAFAKPVVGTRVGGIPELVEDGKTGFLADRGDAAGLAARLVTLARDSALRTRFGLAGAARAAERFDLRKNALALLEVYREIVGPGFG